MLDSQNTALAAKKPAAATQQSGESGGSFLTLAGKFGSAIPFLVPGIVGTLTATRPMPSESGGSVPEKPKGGSAMYPPSEAAPEVVEGGYAAEGFWSGASAITRAAGRFSGDLVVRARRTAREARENPIQLIAGAAAAGFSVGILLRLLRKPCRTPRTRGATATG